jgi:serine protease Do
VVSSSQFSSSRQVSRGYLGVTLQDHNEGGVVLVQVDEGAARRAGLQVGDVILQVNEQIIRNRPEILKFLGSVDPQTNIKAKVRRETTEFEASITLGAPPSQTGHAADLMDKSLRRDGFTSVISHDAVIPPNSCGGPVYDVDGKFVGVNIARHSRVRTFFVPASLIREFIEKHDK